MELCIACLAFDVKLYCMEHKTFLNICYEQLTGTKINQHIIINERKLFLLNSNLNITKNTNIDIIHTSRKEIQNGNTTRKEKNESLPHSSQGRLTIESFTVKNEIETDNIIFQSDHDNNSILDEQLLSVKVKEKKIKNVEFKKKSFESKQKSSFREFATEIIFTLEEQKAELKLREFSLNYLHCLMKCEFCFKGFLEQDAFKNHMAKHDESAGTFVCSVCLLRYANVRRLREHVATAHARRFRCNQCGNLSHTTGQARVHDDWHKGVTFQCQLCGETFTKPTTHLNHMRKKHPTNIACNICGLSFIGKHGLAMHKKKMHANNETQRLNNKTLNEESENINTGEGTIDKQNGEGYCSDCDISFATKSALMRHIMSSSKHALESNRIGNVCRICGASFPTCISLTRHSRSHAPRLPRARMACDKCHATFASGAGVRAHTSRAHGYVDNASERKCYVCDVCGKTCRSNAILQYHLRTHTDERPYPCQHCPKRFPDRTQLSLHARTHSGERPYACTKCSAKFKQKGALNRHVRIHTGEKPHQCNVCRKTFSRTSTLKNHIVSVHLTKLDSVQLLN